MLELLPSPLLVTVRNCAVVDLLHVGEAVDNKCAEEHRVAHLVPLDGQTNQIGEGLELGYLNETVNVVILEEQTLQFLEPLQLRDV